jgi:predicted PurR-regulated permease PerM
VFRDGINSFFGDSFRTLRDYGRARTVMSAIVAVVIGIVSLILGLPLVFTIVVVNFIGGYIPCIGAFLGGGLAVLVALATAESSPPGSCSSSSSGLTWSWKTLWNARS